MDTKREERKAMEKLRRHRPVMVLQGLARHSEERHLSSHGAGVFEGLRAFSGTEAQVREQLGRVSPGAVRSANSLRAQDILDSAQGCAWSKDWVVPVRVAQVD